MTVKSEPKPADRFNPFDLSAPHALWQDMRNEQPVFQHGDTGYFVVTRHADIKAVFDDWKTFSSENAQAPMRPMCAEGKKIMTDGGFTAYSGLSARIPPDHTRIRKIVQGAFGPRRFRAMEPKIEQIVADAFDRIEPKGHADFFRDVAYDVPAFVLFKLVGVPDSDVEKVKAWSVSRALLTWGELSDAEQLPHAHNMVDYWAYCRALVASKRATPGDDLPSDLLQLQADGADITDDEIAGVMYSVLFAGHETTTTLMTNGVHTLLSNRDAWEAICADPALIPKATEEILRFAPSIVAWRRRAKADAEIGGVAVPEGSDILLIMGSGNRDEAVFDHGETFDMHRDNARNHLSFGYGIHFCLGFQLAKLEFGIMLRQLTERFPDARLTGDGNIEYLPNVSFRVPSKLEITWGKGS
ncbi:cytochrome P450 [Oceaniglobus ichthyenteri]|uniref:cytochrome P450 n=1 Tax=Oceaniglobus ichthyenteri TaxID=2136177 RepID=UPI000D336EA5|nr:cytochrome P450 [Oceaniglobus ichthyenteri]